MTDDYPRRAVLQHETDALFGQARVQGQVGRARFEDAEEGDDGVGGAGKKDADDVARLHASLDEGVGELVGAGVELGVGEGRRVVQRRGHGEGVGPEPGLFLHPIDHGFPRGQGLARTVSPCQHLGQFAVGVHGQAGDGNVGPGDDGLQQRPVVFDEALDGGFVEDVSGVAHDAHESVVGLGQGKGEIEFDRARFDIEIAPIEPLQGGDGVECVLEDEQSLNQRVAGEVTGGLEGFDHVIEGDLLMGEGFEDGLAGAPKKGCESGIVGEVGPHDQGVDKEADKGFQLGMVAVGAGDAHSQIVLHRVAMDEGLERGQGDHEQGGVVGLGEPLQAFGQGRVEVEGDVVAAEALEGRAGKVGGEVGSGRKPAQAISPIRQVGFQTSFLPTSLLPCCEIRILDGQFGQLGIVAREFGPIEFGQFPDHHAQGPAIGDDVVQGESEDVVVGIDPVAVGAE